MAKPNPNPFQHFAFEMEGEFLQARAEVIACHEMMSSKESLEPDVQETISLLIASTYARLDRIRDAHRQAFAASRGEVAA